MVDGSGYAMYGLMSVKFTDDKFAIITLTDGENRLNNKSVTAWHNALDAVERSDSKALLTTGTGKFYSNGVDLNWLIKHAKDYDVMKKYHDDLNGLFWRIMHFPIPTVAVLNGHTFAGGAVLSACHDYRVMTTERGWLCWNEVKINMQFPKETLQVMSRKMSRTKHIREALIFGKRFTAQEAVNQHLVDASCFPRDLLSVGKKLALEALGPTGLDRNSLQTMKKDLYPRAVLPSSKI